MRAALARGSLSLVAAGVLLACGRSSKSGPMGGTGGTGQPPACGFYGQGCSISVPCCTGYACVVAGTRSACTNGASCICTAFID